MRTAAIVVVALLAWGVLAPGSPLLAGETVTVDVHKYTFIPLEITVEAGTTVRWLNTEKRQYHSVWFKETGEPEPEYFWPEEFFERSFDKPGVYP